jgi:type IV secretion system protein VirB10
MSDKKNDLIKNLPLEKGHIGKTRIYNPADKSDTASPSGDINDHLKNMAQQTETGKVAGEEEHNENDPEKAEIDYGLSAVAQNPKQSIITMIIIVLIIGGLAYYFFFRTTTPKKQTSDIIPIQPADQYSQPVNIPSIPSVPVPPTPTQDFSQPSTVTPPVQSKPVEPKKDAPTPPQPTLTPHAPVLTQEAVNAQQSAAQRLKANIMVKQGSVTADSKNKNANPLAAQGIFIPEQTSATQQQVTQVGEMSTLIAQGKVIDAVLESSIISYYPGPVRALTTRDVFSEQGNNVLVPKGSRLIGTFVSGYVPGQDRIMITWNRLIMPSGYDIAIDSPSADPEGILGTQGDVNTQFAQIIANAALVSALNIAFTKVASNATNSNSATSTSASVSSGTTQTVTTQTPTQAAIAQAGQNFGQTLQNYAQQNFVTKPYISIPHGTRVNIFVNKDLLFPQNMANGVNVVK